MRLAATAVRGVMLHNLSCQAHVNCFLAYLDELHVDLNQNLIWSLQLVLLRAECSTLKAFKVFISSNCTREMAAGDDDDDDVVVAFLSASSCDFLYSFFAACADIKQKDLN